jgi:hypothetical protein
MTRAKSSSGVFLKKFFCRYGFLNLFKLLDARADALRVEFFNKFFE